MSGGTSPSLADPPAGLRVGLGISRPPAALAVLVALLVVIVAGLWATTAGRPPQKTGGTQDSMLYQQVIEDVRHGEPYYRAATREQRRLHYPLRPFFVVRPPLLATALAALPDELSRRLALAGLGLATLLAWGWRLGREGLGRLDLAAAMLLLSGGVVLAFASTAYGFHDVWAGLLIALSLALRRPNGWVLSLGLGLLAALTRELAAAYLLAMAVMAWRDGGRREATGWIAAVIVSGLALAAHAAAVTAQLLPGDPPSQGWVRMGGLSFVISTLHWNGVLLLLQLWVAAIVGPFALLGLAGWRDRLGERVALTVFGYLAAFAFVGRPENAYWGLLIAPLWPLGLVFAPRVLAGLLGALRGRPQVAA